MSKTVSPSTTVCRCVSAACNADVTSMVGRAAGRDTKSKGTMMAGWSFPGPTGDVRQTTVWRVAAEDSRLYASVSAVDEVNDVVQDWLTVPDIAKKLGISVVAVRRLIEDRELIAVRRGERNVLSVPADFVDGAGPVPALKGHLQRAGRRGILRRGDHRRGCMPPTRPGRVGPQPRWARSRLVSRPRCGAGRWKSFRAAEQPCRRSGRRGSADEKQVGSDQAVPIGMVRIRRCGRCWCR
jgi:hypothetical protein